jgi:FixJ family two-component response regulator
MNKLTHNVLNTRRPVTVDDQKLAERYLRGRVIVIDDDEHFLAALAALFDLEGYACETYPLASKYLQVIKNSRPTFPGPCCVLCDVNMPELDGLELQKQLVVLNDTPFILMSGSSGAQEAVSGFRAGAQDFLIKPIDADYLLGVVGKALDLSSARQNLKIMQAGIMQKVALLTNREREIALLVAKGQLNREIADALGIVLRTVKLHRHRVMEKLEVETVIDLARIVDEGNIV